MNPCTKISAHKTAPDRSIEIIFEICVCAGSSTGGLNATTFATSVSLVILEKFQHILRVFNTNIYGWYETAFTITSFKGVGRRSASVVLKKADINFNKNPELTEEEVEWVHTIIQSAHHYKIPDRFLNRWNDGKDGTCSQVLASGLVNELREDAGATEDPGSYKAATLLWPFYLRLPHQDHWVPWP